MEDRETLGSGSYPHSTRAVEYVEDLAAFLPGFETRPYQLDALDALVESRREDQRALLHMATGLGKTTVVALDVRRFLEEQSESRVLFLCHQNDILDQARNRFEEIVGDEFTYGSFTGEGARDYHSVSCLFASFQVMRDWKEAFLEDEFDYIVVDESHHAKATTYEPILDYFKPQFLLGVTGTPDRHDLQDIREIFGPEIYSMPLEEAIAEGLLANVDYRVITDNIIDRASLQGPNDKRVSKAQLNRSIFIPKRDEEIARIIIDRSKEIDNPRRIVFCPSIEYTEELASHFSGSEPLHSRLPGWMQDQVIEKFRNGSLSTILVVDMFNEGMDIPEANQIVFLRSTQSKPLYLQQLGRGLRKTPGKESVQVLDFVANCDRLTMIDDLWREVQRYAEHISSNAAPEVIRIDYGNVAFSEEARNILEILAEIEGYNDQVRNWSAEDSISYYRHISTQLGRAATAGDIEFRGGKFGEGPPLSRVLRDFDGKVYKLRSAAGYEVPPDFEFSSEDEAIDFMLEIMDRHGRLPKTQPESTKMGGPLPRQYREYFPTFKEYKMAVNRRWLERRRISDK